jgi:hypothetical protein
MRRHRQRGASGLMIAVVLVLLMAIFLAIRVLSRLGDTAQDKGTTIASLNRAQAALDAFVAAGGGSNARLPCPADPSIDETASPMSALAGLEQTQTASTCKFDTGTLPWLTIGLRKDDSYDAWGRKLSYRVYDGNKGSLTQVAAGGYSGPSMANCNDSTSAGGGVTKNPNPVGLCALDHTTSKFDFLTNNKGLQVTDFGTVHAPGNNASADPVAYVVISHGPTGLGGYSASGVQVVTQGNKGPGGDENDHTKATGPFHVEAWSDPDTAATDNSHFDDLLVYRTIADLAQKAGLQARAWGVASLTFDAPTIALGGGDTSGPDMGTNTLTFGTGGTSTVIRGFTGSNTATDISYDTTNGNSGIGVYGGGSASLMSYSSGEWMQVSLGATARQFAITLNDFSIALGFTEQVELDFFKGNGNTPVYTVQKAACGTDPSVLTTYSINVGVDFDRVQVRPQKSTLLGVPLGDTAFSISALSACRSGVTCTTALATGGITCP